MPRRTNADAVLECYRRAAEAHQIAKAAADPITKADFFELEKHWRILACKHELELGSLSASVCKKAG